MVPTAMPPGYATPQQNKADRKRPAEVMPPETPGSKIAWAMSLIRSELSSIDNVEGVQHVLAQMPNCVLVGSNAARRDMVAALLGEHAHAGAAASALVAQGVRQPVAVELRSAQAAPETEQEAQDWLQSVMTAMQRAIGNRLRMEPLRLRLSAPGGADLDLVELPERAAGGSSSTPEKLEQIRSQHLGAPANLLVCLEPGPAFEHCRRYDPHLNRTVMVGAANDGASAAVAASTVQAQFTQLCSKALPRLQDNLRLLDTKLQGVQRETQSVLANEAVEGTVARARTVGLSFGRALQNVVGGTPGCHAGALTLEAELVEFAAAMEKGDMSFGEVLNGKKVQVAVQEMWKGFQGGVRGYSKYLDEDVRATGADMELNGGAAWQRLLVEIEVAMRLSHPSPDEIAALAESAMQAGGTTSHGPQRWDDVASKLLMSIAFEPLFNRIQYVAARVAWVLRQQKAAVAEWMATLADGAGHSLHSPLFAQHLHLLRSSPLTRDLVFAAFDKAADTAAARLLENLESTLTAGCLNPGSVLRPRTSPSVSNESQATQPQEDPRAGRVRGRSGRDRAQDAARQQRMSESRRRVTEEVRRRSGSSGGLLPGMRDRTFQPNEVTQEIARVEQELRRAFSKLGNILANQTVAFADTTLTGLCRRYMEEAMSSIGLDADQERAVGTRHAELQQQATVVDEQLAAVRRCAEECQKASVQAGALGAARRRLHG